MRKMNTLLLASLFLLYLQEVTGLKCNTCIYTEGWKCMAGQGTCIAKENELCSTTAYFRGEKHMHSTHMCKYKCLEEESYKKDLLRVTLCFDKNFCNAF
ncbi:prostate and testis expressed protein 4 [Callithrix jacchus]|nr:prostate and testis expressed protein 4 [Callithrix jacchus]